MLIVFGLAGKAGRGKTTLAKYLKERYGARVYSLSEPLKRMAKAIWQFSDEQLYGPQEIKEKIDPRWNISPRKALQLLGTDAIRAELGEDIWCNLLFDRIEGAGIDWGHYFSVIDDIRFPNEANRLRRTFSHGYIIKLDCPDVDDAAGKHASETSVDNISSRNIDLYVNAKKSPGAELLIKAFEEGFPSLGEAYHVITASERWSK